MEVGKSGESYASAPSTHPWTNIHTSKLLQQKSDNHKGVFGRVRTKVHRGYVLGKYPTEVFG